MGLDPFFCPGLTQGRAAGEWNKTTIRFLGLASALLASTTESKCAGQKPRGGGLLGFQGRQGNSNTGIVNVDCTN